MATTVERRRYNRSKEAFHRHQQKYSCTNTIGCPNLNEHRRMKIAFESAFAGLKVRFVKFFPNVEPPVPDAP